MTDLSPEARAIVDAARVAERPPPGAQKRIQAAILAGIATGAGPASAATGAATSAKVGSAGLGLKLLAPLAIVALGLGGAWVAGAFDEAPERRLSPQPSALSPQPEVASTEPEVELVAEPEPEVEPEPEPEVEVIAVVAPKPEKEPVAEVEREPVVQKPKPVVRSPKPESATSIKEELEIIRGVQKAIKGGDGRAALALIADHAERFPRGQLVQEREAARVRALCALDRVDAARAAAAEFLERWPKSPQSARVRSSCAEVGE
jgi:hypothetical protein